MYTRFVALGLILFTSSAHGYVQYSLRHGIVSCRACHHAPAGGGSKTLYGKLYSHHGLKANPILAQQYVSADLRMLYYRPLETKGTKGGAGVMSGSVAGHVFLDPEEKFLVVLEHNLAGFSQAAYRDTYALYDFSKNQPAWFETLQVGRIRVPFGLVTDEHRTYTRMQTASDWLSLNMGAVLSGSPFRNAHYDLTLVNGKQNVGQNLSADQSDRFGFFANLRWQPRTYLLGASARSEQAWSVYAGGSRGSWTLMTEFAQAKGLNDFLSRGFASQAAFAAAAQAATSEGWLLWLEWAANPRLALLYKLDWFVPDRDFPADHYERHGVGLRWTFAPGAIVQARSEWAQATPPMEKGGTGQGALSAVWALLQVSL